MINRKHFGIGSAVAALVLMGVLVSAAWATDPASGTYTSVDFGYGSQDVLMGRGTNARPPVDTGVNNVFNSASWDGSTLGTQWIFSCGVSTSQTRQDNRVSGTGTMVFTTNYAGGTFWLSKNGPWGDGSVDFTGTINALVRITTLQYVSGNVVSARENINTSGNFDGSNCFLTFVITNAVGVGDTDISAFDSSYPALLDTGCAANGTSGSWGDVRDITMQIDCLPNPAKSASWGKVKSLYR